MVVHPDGLEGKMAKVSLTATLEHDEAKLDFLKVAWKQFLAGLPTMGFTVESEWVGHVTHDAEAAETHTAAGDDIRPRETLASSLSVDFGSSEAAELADSANLTDRDFDGMKPSGTKGYGVGDVRKIISSK